LPGTDGRGPTLAAVEDGGEAMTVENDFSASVGGNQAGKSTEIWIRK
jgi:hypothetical protein